VEILGKKSGAFEAVASGDPTVFLPENLKQFDAIVMNNTHEKAFWLPRNLEKLPPAEQKAAKDREETVKGGFYTLLTEIALALFRLACIGTS
jgi:hypothetical protein